MDRPGCWGAIACEARALLEATPVAELLKVKDVVTLSMQECSVKTALATLARRRLLSAPVLDSQGHAVGFTDVRALLGAFLAKCDDGGSEGVFAGKPMLQRMRLLEALGAEFAEEPLSEAMLSVRGCVYAGGPELPDTDGAFMYNAKLTSNLGELISDGYLIETKEGEPRGNHRIAIYDESCHIVSIVSQTDVCRFLLKHAEKLPRLMGATLQELGLVPKGPAEHALGPVSVTPERPTIEALSLCFSAQLSAVPIVDGATGELIGNLSVSDLRGVETSHFSVLALPVAEFLALLHKTAFVGYSASESKLRAHEFFKEPGALVGQHLVTLPATATYQTCLESLVLQQLHRVYITSADNRPIGLVTLTDLLAVVA